MPIIHPTNMKLIVFAFLCFLSLYSIGRLVWHHWHHYLKSLSQTELEEYNRKKENEIIKRDIQRLEDELLILIKKSKEIDSKKEELSRALNIKYNERT